MKVALVNMPWHALELPSIAVGILHEVAASVIGPGNVHDYYANLMWADYLIEQSDGAIGPAEYAWVANYGFFYGMGEWIFAHCLNPEVSRLDYQYADYLLKKNVD